MRIGIDISPVLYGTGVSIYTQELVSTLLKLDKKNEYALFGGSLRRKGELEDYIQSLQGNFTAKLFNLPPVAADFLWNRLHIFNIENLIGKIDVFHSSDWTQPPSNSKKVTTIHDLAPFKYPSETHSRIRAVHKRRLRWVKKEVDAIIVPSNATKNDLTKMGFSNEKIAVIPEASSSVFYKRSEKEISHVKNKWGIVGDYLLTVGNSERKNLSRASKALKKVSKKNKLVVAARTSHNISAENVISVHNSSDDELAALYSGAQALLYPSLYEGFGLPILQAFSCECPVVTSNISSMPEVAGDAAVLVDPLSVESIANGIKSALKNKNDLIKKGKKRVKNFSWEKTAKETLKVYESLLV